MNTFVYRRRLHHHETDADGVCHASNYLRLFEEALCDVLRSLERPPEHLSHNIAIAQAVITYKHPLSYGDQFEVTLRFVAIRRARFDVLGIVRLDGRICTEISCILAAVDRVTRTSVSFDRDLHQTLLGASDRQEATQAGRFMEPGHVQ
ncbi:hypothetical protein BPMI_03778 [Candidatus Burkholderia pumila]|uniref:4-hydroxybenzoyl-CoA thioesterase family active site n=1 Tax=Candidatus Burkholderia pumila TaxID=1090375 RepID=A0ABR5HLD9_9BURK|nr:hypothetical protein BPMI_03778 [Candidatus Burkholderia pumila]